MSPATLVAALLCQLGAGAGHRRRSLRRKKRCSRPRSGSRSQEHLDATERARRTVVCIAIDPGRSSAEPKPGVHGPAERVSLRCVGRPNVTRAQRERSKRRPFARPSS